MEYKTIIDFWFTELSADEHFTQSDVVDDKIRSFSELYASVVRGEVDDWRGTPEGALAEIVVLDQFSRNMFRGSEGAFLQDEQALKLAQDAIKKGFDMEMTPEKRMFLYMPYMHSESREVHQEAVVLFKKLGLEKTLTYELAHKEIIDTFGRYPHRNRVLGRQSTQEEEKYLEENKGSFF